MPVVRFLQRYIGSLVFRVVYTILGLLLSIIGLVVLYCTRHKVVLFTDFFAFYMRVSHVLLHVLCGIRVHLPPSPTLGDYTPTFYASNHQSSWETNFMLAYFRPTTPMLKREILSIPVMGTVAKSFEPIALERHAERDSMKDIMAQCEKAINMRRNILVFPEGTRRSPDVPFEFKRSFTLLAAAVNAPIVPVYHNMGTCWHKSVFFTPGDVYLVLGEPIVTAGRRPKEICVDYEAAMSALKARVDIQTEAYKT